MIADAGSGPPRTAAAPRDRAAALWWLAAGAIALSVLLMAAVPATVGAGAVPYIPRSFPAPPWWLPLHPSRVLTLLTLYASVLLGVAGVGCGLVAVRRGSRPSARVLLAGSAIAITVLTLVPPAGSTDSLNYAVYGRIAALGHSPYVMTPLELRKTGDPVAVKGTLNADSKPSVYGPLATATEWAAAELGGASISRILFWLKVEFALAYGAVAIALHRLLRPDPAARVRAHLLWSVNPVMLWALLAGAHVDVLAAALCFFGLIIARPTAADGARIGTARALAAGLLVGAGADFKINYVLLGVGVAWATRRSWADMAAAAAGAALALIPGYLVLARGFLGVVPKENQLVPLDSFWRLLPGFSELHHFRALIPVAALVFLVLALFLAWRLPPGADGLPAIRPALAVALAWLFVWPLQHPWYDAMAFCLLAAFVPSWLDWLLLVRAIPTTLAAVPNIAQPFPPHWLYQLSTDMVSPVSSVTRLGALAALVVVCAMRAKDLPGRHRALY